LASSCSTIATLPPRAAVISGVSPERSAAFGFARARNSTSTMAVFSFSQADQRGVTPRSVAAFTAAPARISRLAVSASFQ
jgi:hypothetical protein